jgi:hypothetical protein
MGKADHRPASTETFSDVRVAFVRAGEVVGMDAERTLVG